MNGWDGMGKALIISDQADVVQPVRELLTSIGHSLSAAGTLKEGWAAAGQTEPDAVVLDASLPDGDGLVLLPRLRQLPNSPEVVVIARNGDPRAAEFALRNGAWDYLVLHADARPVAVALDQALQYREEQRNDAPAIAVKREKIIGNSPGMKACFELLGQAAACDANVLVIGETGTGKELFARAIHSNSPRSRIGALTAGRRASNPRADKNFVVVDCTALPETLVESVLFGHVKGAFTSADRDQEGLIAQADGGTLFLDEVGELPPETQKAFLRVLQERRYRPVGGQTERESNFRLVAATNRNLDELVAEGTFRKDLLFRLRSMTIELPPLRQRPEDIQDLVRYHTARLCDFYDIHPKGLSPELLETLTAYAWPGNVRELVNTIDGMLAITSNDLTLYAKHLPLHIRVQVVCGNLQGPVRAETVPAAAGAMPPYKSYREETEIRYLQDLLNLTSRNIPKACEISGISRSRLYEMLAKHGLND